MQRHNFLGTVKFRGNNLANICLKYVIHLPSVNKVSMPVSFGVHLSIQKLLTPIKKNSFKDSKSSHLSGLNEAAKIHRPSGEEESEDVQYGKACEHDSSVRGVEASSHSEHPAYVQSNEWPHIQPPWRGPPFIKLHQPDNLAFS